MKGFDNLYFLKKFRQPVFSGTTFVQPALNAVLSCFDFPTIVGTMQIETASVPEKRLTVFYFQKQL
jgi:hypothetical protein